MPRKKIGHYIPCPICGEEFYKKPSDYKFKKKSTCGKPTCTSEYFRGERNPFWGKNHTEDSKAKMSESLVKLGGERLKGIKKKPMSPESRLSRSVAMKLQWKENREARMAALPRGEDHHWQKPPQERRHRHHFSPWQRNEWKGDKCIWCDSTDNLVLDHILPIAAGGPTIRENSQTLCQPCNLWKMWFVDRPLSIVVKATSGGQSLSG